MKILRRHLIIAAFFGGLAWLVMFPVSLDPVRQVAGPESDFYHFHWNFWWARAAFFDAGKAIFFTDYIHVPFQQNLALHTLTLAWLPLYLGLEPVLGPLLVVNLMFWLSLTLTGYLTLLFCRAEGLSYSAGLLSGTLLVVMPYLAFHVEKFHLNIVALFWLPGLALLWRQVARRRTWPWAVLMGIALWGMWLTGTQWLVWTPLFLAAYGLKTLVEVPDARTRWQLIVLGLAAVAVMAGLAWAVGPWRQMAQFEGEVQPVTLDAAAYWSLPVGFLWGEYGSDDQRFSLVLVGLVLASLLVRGGSTRWRWLWLAVGLTGLVLALGPSAGVAGQTIPLPYRWLHAALDGLYRAPVRFVPVAALGLALFCGLSLQQAAAHLPGGLRRGLAGLLFLLLLADSTLFHPLPAYTVPDYRFYHTIGATDDSDVVLVEVPLGVVNGWNAVGDYWPVEQYYGIYHHKRMVNGFVAREPTSNYLFYEQSPLWNWLAGNIPLDYDAARAEFDRYLHEWPIGYVVVRQSDRGPDHPLTLAWLQFFNSHPEVCGWQVERDAVVYRTAAHAAGCPAQPADAVDVGTDDLTRMGFGWSWVERFGGRTSRWMAQEGTLYLHPTSRPTRLRMAAIAFHTPRQVTVWANDQRLGTVTVTPDGFQTVTLNLDNLDILPGEQLALHLVADAALSAQEAGLSADERPLSIAVDHITLEGE